MTTQTTLDIVSNEEIERVHANANFGSMGKRQVVNEGVLKYASGYHCGYTQVCILQEHGLVYSSMSRKQGLSEKGIKYFKAMLREAPYKKLAEIFNV